MERAFNFLLYLSDAIVPLLIFLIVAWGLAAKVQVYDDFVKGAKDGFLTVIKIMPTLIGLMVAVGILRASGFLDFLSELLCGFTDLLHFPSELVPLTVVRLFSSSAATGLALDLYKQYGTDSRIGLLASLMMSCTETVFYTMSVYFMTAKVRKTRYTLAGSLVATAAGIGASMVLAGMLAG
ncbi:MAG: spore maturation protein [Lachnospiraceae bacterium]|jgi:spore maturation protein B|nr:spore maturation protein [Lachnospiraceae bacterium]